MSSTLDALGEVRGKRVLVRSDLNVPLDGTTITDDGRIRASIPTIRELAEAGAKVIVTAHLGRPKGAPDPAYSLAPVAARTGSRDCAFCMRRTIPLCDWRWAGSCGRLERRSRVLAMVWRRRKERWRRRSTSS